MIAREKNALTGSEKAPWHAEFLKLLPTIERYARVAFRYLDADARDEAVQETICNVCRAFARLARQRRADVATPKSLARYAVAQVRAVGFSFGSRLVELAHRAGDHF